MIWKVECPYPCLRNISAVKSALFFDLTTSQAYSQITLIFIFESLQLDQILAEATGVTRPHMARRRGFGDNVNQDSSSFLRGDPHIFKEVPDNRHVEPPTGRLSSTGTGTGTGTQVGGYWSAGPTTNLSLKDREGRDPASPGPARCSSHAAAHDIWDFQGQ